MNNHKATIAIVVLLLLGAFFYERQRRQEVQATLDSLAKDRDTLNRRVESLARRLAQNERNEPVPATASEVPRVAVPVAAATPPAEQREVPVETPGVTIKAPAGWHLNGSKTKSYVVGVDQTQTWAGQPSAYVRSLESGIDGFGGMMQTTSAENYAGKRVRLSGYVKTEDANDGGGHLWLRVDGQQSGQMLGFDNMDNRPVKGTTDWQPYSIVLDVPAESSALAYGFFVHGSGKMWVSGAKMEEVGADVPTTNMIKQPARSLPKTPVNLEFR